MTKSSLMVGLGETREEVLWVMEDLLRARCDILVIGQYLKPTPAHLPVAAYLPPKEFRFYAARAREMGFASVMAEPFARSSYLADRHLQNFQEAAL